MLSGDFTGSTNNQYVQPRIVWSASQSIDGNYSDVTATLYYSRTNSGYQTWGAWSGSIIIGGNTTSGSGSITITYNSNTQAMTASARIYHDADGTKSITISATGGIPSTSFTSTSISADITLDTIPRATVPVLSSSSVTMGDTLTITLPRASSSFTHQLQCRFGSQYFNFAFDAETSYTWTVPTATLAPEIPNAASGVGSIICITKSGSTTIGSASVQFTALVPASVKPSTPTISVTEATSGLAAKFGAFVQWKSSLAIGVASSSQYGAGIRACAVTVDGTTYNTYSFTSNVIKSSGTLTISATVTDTRGRTATGTTSITVLPYANPSISKMAAWRIKPDQTADDEGERIAVTLAYQISPVGNKNDRNYVLRYRKTSDSSYTDISSGPADYSHDAATQFLTAAPVVSSDSSYVIQLEISDFFSSADYEVSVPTAEVTYCPHASGRGFAFGKVAETEGILDVAWPIRMQGNTIADVVVESGSSAYWTWRKWASGVAECWRVRSCGNVSCTVPWGVFYESTDSYGPDAYPFTFTATPTQTMFASRSSGGIVFVEPGGNSAASTGSWWLYRPVSTSGITAYVSIYAIGKWK
ncbi:MAG: DUF859 family phage minor structural protein [Oscillospiraceae bacterium]|nr:DUF859 family phage minor structural protein [Oscillospiraceae bacterium]